MLGVERVEQKRRGCHKLDLLWRFSDTSSIIAPNSHITCVFETINMFNELPVIIVLSSQIVAATPVVDVENKRISDIWRGRRRDLCIIPPSHFYVWKEQKSVGKSHPGWRPTVGENSQRICSWLGKRISNRSESKFQSPRIAVGLSELNKISRRWRSHGNCLQHLPYTIQAMTHGCGVGTVSNVSACDIVVMTMDLPTFAQWAKRVLPEFFISQNTCITSHEPKIHASFRLSSLGNDKENHMPENSCLAKEFTRGLDIWSQVIPTIEWVADLESHGHKIFDAPEMWRWGGSEINTTSAIPELLYFSFEGLTDQPTTPNKISRACGAVTETTFVAEGKRLPYSRFLLCRQSAEISRSRLLQFWW